MKAVRLDLYGQRGADIIQLLAFGYYDVSSGELIEHDYDAHDFVLVMEDEYAGTDLILASVDNGQINTGQSWTTVLEGSSEVVEFSHAISIHLPSSVTDIEPGTYPITLIRTVGAVVDKSVLGTLTIEAAGGADG